MKITLILLLNFGVIMSLRAQKIEISFQANTGTYHYSGVSATAVSSFIETGNNPARYYTNNPYGSNGGFSYGAGIQAQRVSNGGFIMGLQAGYDVLRSEETINFVNPLIYLLDNIPNPAFNNYSIAVNGKTYLQNKSINLSPYIGYRIKSKKINFDLMPGVDFAFNLNAEDKGKATGNDGTVFITNNKNPDAPTDIRLKFGIAAGYKKWGITAGYAHGLRNLYKGVELDGNPHVIHSELLRFGITYRIF